MKQTTLTIPNGKMQEFTTWCIGNDIRIVSSWGSAGFSFDEKTTVYLLLNDESQPKLENSDWYKKYSKA